MKKILKKDYVKKDSGITLIALVVTIIVLLILASVTLRFISNNDGIFGKAENAKNVTEAAREQEQIKLVISSVLIDNYRERVIPIAQFREEMLAEYEDELVATDPITQTDNLDKSYIKISKAKNQLNLEKLLMPESYAEEEEETTYEFALIKYKSGRNYYVKIKKGEVKPNDTVGTIYGDKASNTTTGGNGSDDKKEESKIPENLLFIWGSDDPSDPEYHTVIGYKEGVQNYTVLTYPARCTKITFDDAMLKEKGYDISEIRAFIQNIREIEIPNGVTEIGSGAFYGSNFSKVETIYIPKTVTVIGENSFYDCFFLKEIRVEQNGTYGKTSDWSSLGVDTSTTEIMIVTDSNGETGETESMEDLFVWGSDDPSDPEYHTVIGYQGGVQNYTVLTYPARCTKITFDDAKLTQRGYDFSQMRTFIENIQEIKIPNGVTEIESFAFYSPKNFVNVKTIYIPKTVTTIGNYAFKYDLEEIKVEQGGTYSETSDWSSLGVNTTTSITTYTDS